MDPAAVIDVLLQKSPVVETHHSTNDATQQELGPTGHESHGTHSASYGNECLVCLESFKPESNVAILPCRAGHRFHYNCIQGTLASLSCRRAVGRGDGFCVFVLAPVVWYALRIHFSHALQTGLKVNMSAVPPAAMISHGLLRDMAPLWQWRRYAHETAAVIYLSSSFQNNSKIITALQVTVSLGAALDSPRAGVLRRGTRVQSMGARLVDGVSAVSFFLKPFIRRPLVIH